MKTLPAYDAARNPRLANRGEPSLFTPAPLPVAALDEAGRVACLRLIRSSNIGPVTFRKLINLHGGAEQALAALPEIAQRSNSTRKIKICPKARAEAELEAAENVGATPLFTIEPGFPALLAVTDTPPPMLYVKGDAELLNRPCIAIVGSRQSSAAGIKLARTFAAQLGDAGLCIASGLARGIDGAAHQAALANGTIAVVAGGVDVAYPPEHADLQHRIGEQGCVISEMPPGFLPRGTDFPRRNRIIAGISLGVLIIEAARKSGSLITARMASEIGRDVFAVPGHPLDPRAEGTLKLIKEGATLATSASDIIEALNPIGASLQDGLCEPALKYSFKASSGPPTEPHTPPDEADTEKVLSALSPNPIDMDEVARATGLTIRAVRSIIFELDLSGRIEHHGQQLIALRETSLDT